LANISVIYLLVDLYLCLRVNQCP